VWDYHVGSSGRKDKIGTGRYGQSEVFTAQAVPVSVLDPATGEVSRLDGPKYTEPEAEAFWRPVADGVREILKKRGMENAVCLGICGDYIPEKAVSDLWAKLMPGAGWVTMAHGTTTNIHGQPVVYATAVFGASFRDPSLERKRGWQKERNIAYFPRYAGNEYVLGMAYERTFYEFGLLCGLRGAGRQVLDDFHDMRTRKGSGTKCNWGSLTPGPAWLGPGTDGPVATERFEVGVEGIQECEARIFIEQVLGDEALKAKLGEKLAAECLEILDERTRCASYANEQNTNQRLHSYLPGGPLGCDWFAGSDWQGRSRKLYAAAAAVEKAIGPRASQTAERGGM
jgi:hypothetical protein